MLLLLVPLCLGVLTWPSFSPVSYRCWCPLHFYSQHISEYCKINVCLKSHHPLCCFNSFDLGRWVFYHCLISGANLCLLRVFCSGIIIRKKSELYCFREVNLVKKVSLMEMSGMISARWIINQLLFVVLKGEKYINTCIYTK